MCDKIIKLANLQIKGRIEQQTRVYSTKGISPTLNSAMGHGGNNWRKENEIPAPIREGEA